MLFSISQNLISVFIILPETSKVVCFQDTKSFLRNHNRLLNILKNYKKNNKPQTYVVSLQDLKHFRKFLFKRFLSICRPHLFYYSLPQVSLLPALLTRRKTSTNLKTFDWDTKGELQRKQKHPVFVEVNMSQSYS